jgi:hypothetical protein
MTDMPDELKHEIQEALDEATPEAIEWHMVRHPETPWGKAQGKTRYVVHIDSSLTGDCEYCRYEDKPKAYREWITDATECTCGQLGEPAVDEAWADSLEGLADEEVRYWAKDARIADPTITTQGQVYWLQDRWLRKWHKPGEWPTSEDYTEAEVREANLVELEFARKWAADRPQRSARTANVMGAIKAMKKAAGEYDEWARNHCRSCKTELTDADAPRIPEIPDLRYCQPCNVKLDEAHIDLGAFNERLSEPVAPQPGWRVNVAAAWIELRLGHYAV